MIVAIPKETYPGENRVALIPQNVEAVKKAGLDVVVESGAGETAFHSDAEYESRGARVEKDRGRLLSEADVVLMVRGPHSDGELDDGRVASLKQGATLVGMFDPLDAPAAMKSLADRRLTVFSMELMPRTTRAQAMDVLSSMATIAGYKAVVLAAQVAPKIFPMLITAAGTIAPTRVFVLGAGVAGLQAIASARKLGAVASAYDVRPAVKEQVESLGARFIELGLDNKSAEAAGGYAAAQSEEFYRHQQDLLAQHLRAADVIITTAAVPGKRAPILITTRMMTGMTPGTVIVDLAAERGGNCEATVPGERVVRDGVTILGPLNLAATAPLHASQMYSKNISNFLLHLVKDGKLSLDRDDEITSGTLVTHEGQVVHPMVLKALEAAGSPG